MDLAQTLRLAGDNLLHMLNPEENHVPYWHLVVTADYRAHLEMVKGGHSHNVGRWWDAMLRLERATGYAIPWRLEAPMLANVERFTRNPYRILLDDTHDPNDAKSWYVHSFRETMLAYDALHRFRGSAEAARRGRESATMMLEACRDPRRWHFAAVAQPAHSSPLIYSHGRALEGLGHFYASTGDEAALRLSAHLAEFHLAHSLRADGGVPKEGIGNHTHSYLNMLKGLLLFGRATNQRRFLDAVLQTYYRTVRGLFTRSGFTTHDIDPSQFAAGDAASAGDAAQLALWLWPHAQDPELLDDAERFVRARLLPSQVVQPPPLAPRDPAGGGDAYRSLGERMVGAIGGCVGHTWGVSSVTDITASSLHSLLDIYEHIAERTETGIWVLFHFDVRNEFMTMTSERAERARVRLAIHGGEHVHIRIPGWSDKREVRLAVNGEAATPVWLGSFVRVAGSPRGMEIELSYALPRSSQTETSVTQWYHAPDYSRKPAEERKTYRFEWKGDDVVGASPVEPLFPLYPPL